MLICAMNVIKVTPPSHLHVYHIALKKHAVIFASGTGIETYHSDPQENAQTSAQKCEYTYRPSPVSMTSHASLPRIVSGAHGPGKKIA
jgi:hypothetical protein